MSIVRKTILAVALASLAVACGGKNKSENTMDNSGGSDMGTTDDGTGGDAYGGGGMDPCAGAEGGGMDPCGGGE